MQKNHRADLSRILLKIQSEKANSRAKARRSRGSRQNPEDYQKQRNKTVLTWVKVHVALTFLSGSLKGFQEHSWKASTISGAVERMHLFN